MNEKHSSYWTQNECHYETLQINLLNAQKRLCPENEMNSKQNATDTCSVLGSGHSIITLDNLI
jgi:hypothetical protein